MKGTLWSGDVKLASTPSRPEAVTSFLAAVRATDFENGAVGAVLRIADGITPTGGDLVLEIRRPTDTTVTIRMLSGQEIHLLAAEGQKVGPGTGLDRTLDQILELLAIVLEVPIDGRMLHPRRRRGSPVRPGPRLRPPPPKETTSVPEKLDPDAAGLRLGALRFQRGLVRDALGALRVAEWPKGSGGGLVKPATYSPAESQMLRDLSLLAREEQEILDAFVVGMYDREPELERLSLSVVDSGRSWALKNLQIDRQMRNIGIGGRVMEVLVRLADAADARIVLTPAQRGDPGGTTSRARLIRFYKRFGFVENKGRHKDFTISERMFRNPRAPRDSRKTGSPVRPGPRLKPRPKVAPKMMYVHGIPIDRALQEVWDTYPDAVVVLDGSDDPLLPWDRTPEAFAKHHGITPLAYYNTGISAVRTTGIVLDADGVQKFLDAHARATDGRRLRSLVKSRITVHGRTDRLDQAQLHDIANFDPRDRDPWDPQGSPTRATERRDRKERDAIVALARKIRAEKYGSCPVAGACLWHALAVIEAAKKKGRRLVLQAGTAGWRRVPPHLDDGVSATHFSYVWEKDSPTTRAVLARIRAGDLRMLPELHVWAGDPATQELVDVTTRYWPDQAKALNGVDWPGPKPPDYLWTSMRDLPAGEAVSDAVYEPDRDATILAGQLATAYGWKP